MFWGSTHTCMAGTYWMGYFPKLQIESSFFFSHIYPMKIIFFHQRTRGLLFSRHQLYSVTKLLTVLKVLLVRK